MPAAHARGKRHGTHKNVTERDGMKNPRQPLGEPPGVGTSVDQERENGAETARAGHLRPGSLL